MAFSYRGGAGSMIPTPALKPPYLAVIFVNVRTGIDPDGYGHTADAMIELARDQPGYLGHDSVRGLDGGGITVSYWTDETAIMTWKAVGAHRAAQAAGQRKWYSAYTTHIARVERSYDWQASSAPAVTGQSPAET